jgi:spermidine/putrescine-binding protein
MRRFELMRNKTVLAVWLVAILATLLALAPGSGTAPAYSATEEASVGVDEVGYTGPLDKALFVYNWGGYIDETLLKDYETKYSVTITYDNYATNEELFSKLQAGAQYDVIFPTDYMIARLISLNLIAKLDKKNLPNIANIDPVFLDTCTIQAQNIARRICMGRRALLTCAVWRKSRIVGAPSSIPNR